MSDIATAVGPSWETLAVGACSVISVLAMAYAGLLSYLFGEAKREYREGIAGVKLENSTLKSANEAAWREIQDHRVKLTEHEGRTKALERSAEKAVSIDVFNERSDRQDDMLRATSDGVKELKRRLSPGTMQAARQDSDPPMGPPRPRLPSQRHRDGE